MKRINKSVTRKFVELNIRDLAHEMYLCVADEGREWDLTLPDGSNVVIDTDPDLTIFNEAKGTVSFQVSDQAGL